MFWQEVDRERVTAKRGPGTLPPIPPSDWIMPEGRDAYPTLRGRGLIAIDVESKDPDLKTKGPGFIRGDAHIVGVAVGTEDGFRQYYPVRHEMGENLPAEYVFSWLREELSDPTQPKVGANLLYDLEALHYAGVPVAGPIWDVQTAEPLLDETRLTYALDAIARHWLGVGKQQDEMTQWLKKAFGNETNIKSNIYRAPASVVGPYAESDVDLPLRLFVEQRKALESEGLWDLFLLESKLIPLLLKMRLRGTPVNLDTAEQLRGELTREYNSQLKQIKDRTGITPDVWAAESIAKVFDREGVEYPRTERTRAPSFRKEWLLHHPHPVAKMITEARHMDKMKGTFVEGYILNGHVNGRIHTKFNALKSDEGGTVSGRFSSSLPNLQNIPTRTEVGRRIRDAFIAEKGMKWWKYDWSQLEYRILVHYAAATNQPGIQEVVDRYWNDPDTDFHAAVAELTGLSRRDSKAINFGLAYGQGIELLCANLGVERSEGERIMNEYHTRAPYIKALMSATSRAGDERGFIRTLLGRKRRFNLWELGKYGSSKQFVSETNRGEFAYILSDEHLKKMGWSDELILDLSIREPGNKVWERAMRRAGWQRAKLHKTLNALSQGTNADIMKKAMVDCWEGGVFDDDGIGVPYLTVHDELDGPIQEGHERSEKALAEVKHIMENCVKLLVPLRADGGRGLTWGSIQ